MQATGNIACRTSIRRAGVTGGFIVTLLISMLLVTSLAPTIVDQSENARAEAMENRLENGQYENSQAFSPGGASIFALLPLMWAVVGLAIIATAVLGTLKF